MFVPLVVLAVLALDRRLSASSQQLRPPLTTTPREFHLELHHLASPSPRSSSASAPASCSTAARTRTRSPSRCFRNRFYIDGIYDNCLVRYFQDAFAAIVHFFDEFLINGLLVGGLSRAAVSFGNLFRKLQSGNLQGYAFAFGLGVILVIYFTVFLRTHRHCFSCSSSSFSRSSPLIAILLRRARPAHRHRRRRALNLVARPSAPPLDLANAGWSVLRAGS